MDKFINKKKNIDICDNSIRLKICDFNSDLRMNIFMTKLLFIFRFETN